MELSWHSKLFQMLSALDLHEALRLRADVFVVEQQCIYADVDGLDPEAIHVLGRDADRDLVAYARILPPDAKGIPHIGRVVVRKDKRGLGLARELMRHAIHACQDAHGTSASAVEAQAHLEAFYESLGYERMAPDHILDGIPHVHMLRRG